MTAAAQSRDLDYLNTLRDYYAENRRIPSFKRIAELMGFASKAASSKLLDRLEASGFVERTPDDDAWMPTSRFFERPLMDFAVRAGAPDMIEGRQGEHFLVDQYLVRQPSRTMMVPVKGDSIFAVRAGAPDMIEGRQGEHFLVDQYLVRQPSRTMMVPVKGDSMIDAGIHEGDIVVVERTKVARAGDFVIAIVDDEFTLKELGLERGKFVLKPHNPAYPVIRPKDQLELFGVVTGLIRRYQG
ncbi:LexA family transcriptional repressor [Denitratisoma oestradiolicum]|uniref:LexA family transcriptional repressor n=1 Tax=Denitratisoma oestradiolicum TaxID=311182 RepID=A0A6S6XQS7_9PROT|nr:LexA family transcriptional regulator [Denitratisoma oestradiolicum]CAB1368281.1 LexA family transcriptional repressor [Denitratisoma oestradiolicum]